MTEQRVHQFFLEYVDTCVGRLHAIYAIVSWVQQGLLRHRDGREVADWIRDTQTTKKKAVVRFSAVEGELRVFTSGESDISVTI